jgi:hypothetical protein
MRKFKRIPSLPLPEAYSRTPTFPESGSTGISGLRISLTITILMSPAVLLAT